MRKALADDLKGAAGLLEGEPGSFEERVHKVRRRLKRDRSLARVYQPVAQELSRQIRLKLRDAGRELAGLRESHALAAAAADLGAKLDEQGEAIILAAVSPAADAASEEEHRVVAAAAKRIAEAELLVEALPEKRGRRLLDRALARAHRRARKAQKRAVRSRATEDLHEWRKALKDLTHLSQFAGKRLRRGGKVRDRARKAEQLLGDDHDLAILRSRVVQQGKTAAARFVSNIEIGGRRGKLQRRAIRLGRKIGAAAPPKLR